MKVITITFLVGMVLILFLVGSFSAGYYFYGLRMSYATEGRVQPTSIIDQTAYIKPFDYTEERKLFSIVNEYRKSNDLPELKNNYKLELSSQLKAEDMANRNYWSHTDPNGVEPWELFKRVGYSYYNASENLAKDFTDATSILDGWKKSPGHNTILVDPKITEAGIGFTCKDIQCIIVMHYGRPM